jgi:hypothetical protein
MGGWSAFDYILNVCRTITDVLHIGTYLLLVVLAILFAAHRCGSKTYSKHVYKPLITFLVKNKCLTLYKTRAHGRSIPTVFKITVWSAASNRLPYIIKKIKDFFNNF